MLDNNQVVRSYLVKESKLIKNKSLEEINRPLIFLWLYKNLTHLASSRLSFFTYTVGVTLLTPAKAEKQDRESQRKVKECREWMSH